MIEEIISIISNSDILFFRKRLTNSCMSGWGDIVVFHKILNSLWNGFRAILSHPDKIVLSF